MKRILMAVVIIIVMSSTMLMAGVYYMNGLLFVIPDEYSQKQKEQKALENKQMWDTSNAQKNASSRSMGKGTWKK